MEVNNPSKRLFKILFLLVAILTLSATSVTQAEARHRNHPIPLMALASTNNPITQFSSQLRSPQAKSGTEAAPSSDFRTQIKDGSTWQWGIELGSLGQKSNIQNDVLGFNLLVGGRVFVILPLETSWAFRSHLGFFTGSGGTPLVNVTEQHFEVGTDLLWISNPKSKSKWLFGLAVRTDGLLSKTQVGNISQTSPITLRLRPGIATGAELKFGPSTSLFTNLDLTSPLSAGFRPNIGLTIGLGFR